MMIHVCPLSGLNGIITTHRCSHVITLINGDSMIDTPATVLRNNHLRLAMNDINETREGMIAPSEEHVEALIAFARRWERKAPMAIHCWAGISRSTAAAYVSLCVLNPRADERAIAARLRAASPTATPNRRIVALADHMLGREGRMSAAIGEIGLGRLAPEGEPFSIGAMFEG